MSTTGIEQIAEWLSSAKQVVAFTGAGISTESGIPDFRSPGGIWARSTPVYYDDFLASAESRHEYWRQKSEAHREFADAQPNVGHTVLAQWESQGKLHGLITQNIDGLHQLAGSHNVWELHGTAREVACLDCAFRAKTDPFVAQFFEDKIVPPCPDCGGRLKHATISFGQPLAPEVMEAASELAHGSDLFFAIGSSLVVEPAASLPRLAADLGAKLVIINRDETPLDPLASAIVREPIGEALSNINALLDSR